MQPQHRIVVIVLAALSAGACLGAAWLTADTSPLRPDTASYLAFDPSRPVGYPIFLWIADKFGGAALAVPMQMLVLASCLFLLGLAFFRWTGRPVMTVLFQLALVLSPEVWKFAAMLLTEATATAAVALWCAQLLRTVRTPTLRGIGLLTIICVAAALIKPSLLPLFLATALLAAALATWRERGWALAMVAGGVLLSISVTPVAQLLARGTLASGSPAARGVLQHTLFCPMPAAPADPDSAFVDRYARAVTDYIGEAPPSVQPGLKRLYTGMLRFGLIIPTLGRRHGMDESWQTDALLSRIARERVTANPGCYARSVLRSYVVMATYKSYSPAEAARLKQFLRARPLIALPVVPLLPSDYRQAERAAQQVGASEPDLPGQPDVELPTGRPILLIWIARFLYGSAAAFGLIALVLLPAQRRMGPASRQLTWCVAVLGVAFHGIIGLTAIAELPLMRYTVTLWPIVCTTLGIAGVFILDRATPFIVARAPRRSALTVRRPTP